MLDRINLILKSRNLNAAQFADEIGVQRSSVSHILTGRNNASLDFLLKVLQRYPEIDTDWLITGKGFMIKSVNQTAEKTVEPIKQEQKSTPISELPKEFTGDLFHQTSEKEQFKPNILNQEANKPVLTGKQETSVEQEIVEQKKPDESATKDTSTRYAEKIVIFYSDKTFTEYNPNR